jgi:hypothetical protein
VHAVAFELIFLEQDLQELGICLLMGLLNPLLQLVDVEAVLVCLEWRLQRHVEDPVLLLATSPDKIDSLTSLKDLIRETVAEECRDHHVIELVFLCPQLVISDLRVSLHEELLERVVDLACKHPCLDHRKNRGRYFLEYSADELFYGWASIQDVGVDRRAKSTTFEIAYLIGDHCQPLHAFKWLLDPEIELPKIQIVRGVVASELGPLAVEDCKQPIVLSKLSLYNKTETLSYLVNI